MRKKQNNEKYDNMRNVGDQTRKSVGPQGGGRRIGDRRIGGQRGGGQKGAGPKGGGSKGGRAKISGFFFPLPPRGAAKVSHDSPRTPQVWPKPSLARPTGLCIRCAPNCGIFSPNQETRAATPDRPPPDRPKLRSLFLPTFSLFFSLWRVFSWNFGGV